MDAERFLGALNETELHEVASGLAVEFERRGLELPALAGAMALEGASADTEVAQAPEADELESLTPEQRERVQALQAALAEKFGLEPEAFGAVAVGKGEQSRLVVMLTAGNGLYKGSWNAIMDKKSAKDFEIEVGGQKIDTRTAMTWEAYQAFVADARARGVELLPDSEPLSKRTGQPWSGTWLTGEKPDGLNARYGYVGYGRPRCDWGRRNDVWRDLRVRPAAEV